MDTDNSPREDEEEAPEGEPAWKVEGEESMDDLVQRTSPSDPDVDGGGMMIYTDERGQRRRIPAERGKLSSGELRAAANALRVDLGGAPADYARIAVIERLTELRASGKMSEEDFLREKKRLENYG